MIKRGYILFSMVLSTFSMAQNEDTTKHHLFCFIETQIVFAKTLPELGKWDDLNVYIAQSKSYNFKTPSLGYGYIYKRKRLFLRMEFSFWYGMKQLSYSYYYADWYGPPPQYQTANTYHDTFSGTAHFYNVDWNNSIGIKIGKRSSIFFGLKKNFLVNYTYRGELVRDIKTYQFYAWGMQSTLLEEETIHLKNDQITKRNHQTISDFIFYSFGYNYQYLTKKGRGIILEASASIPIPIFYGDYGPYSFNLKFGYKLAKVK